MNKNLRKAPRVGSIKKKLLLLLCAGVALSASRNITGQWEIISEVSKEWKKISRVSLKRGLDSLYNEKFIDLKPKGNLFQVVVSRKGKKMAMKFDLENLKISKPQDWDGKWRIVMFDVPERIKKVRDALRFHFKEIGLMEYQKSVFIYPYPCEKEVKFITEFYNAFPSIKLIVADEISDESRFIRKFHVK